MRFPKLRIAWSVAWGVVAVLLCAFWLRSHYWVDQIFAPVGRSTYFCLGSMPNAFGFGLGDKSPTGTWAYLNNPTVDWLAIGDPTGVPWSGATFFRFSIAGAMMPYWFGVLLSAVVGITPWLSLRRFSLRTLLIATTLVAIVLGLATWSLRP